MPKDKTPKEEVKEEKVVEDEVVEEAPKEEKPVKDVPEKEPEEEVKEEPEEKVDVEEVAKQAAEKATKAVREEIATTLGLNKKDEKLAEDEGLIPPWEKRGEAKPKSWKEHAEYSADLAEWKREKVEKEIDKVQEDNEKEAKEVNKRWNDYWDGELKGLEESNDIFAIKDEKDPNDPGRKLRVRLFTKMKDVGVERQEKGLAPITSIELIYHKYKDELNEEPGGAQAPVSFGKKGVGGEDKDDYSYSDIHGKTVDQIKDGS